MKGNSILFITRCLWAGCQEEVGDSEEGLTDTAGALVELVEGVLEWLQPIEFYIHVSGHAYAETGNHCKTSMKGAYLSKECQYSPKHNIIDG